MTRLLSTLLVLILLGAVASGCSAGPVPADDPAEAEVQPIVQPIVQPLASPTHPDALPRLEPDTSFPRVSAEVLAASGFPDHMHSYWWPGWQTLTHEDGTTYGPGAFCNRKTPIPHEDLVIGEDSKAFGNSSGNFLLRHNPGYRACDMLPLLETMVWAAQTNHDLLGLSTGDTLTVLNPDNIPSYREVTGQDIWRLYKLDGDKCIIEPYGTLQARTLDGHAAFMLVTEWLLRKNMPQGMPAWMRQGIVEYISEDGAHLRNYMGQFRANGSPLFSPPLINAILDRGVDPDPGRDREMYRRACYSSFLMVWHLVENEGGLQALRRFLDTAQSLGDYDSAAQEVYDVSMNDLALRLDPAKIGEPVPVTTKVLSPSAKY